MTDTPQKMILIYNPVTSLPMYTVEAPYPDTTLQFYQDLVANDSSIALALVEQSHIHDKCISIVNGETFLVDKPELNITITETTTTDGPMPNKEYPLHILHGVPEFSQVFVDGVEFSSGDTTDFEVMFDTPGTYKIVIHKPPYKEKELTIIVP